MTTPNKIQLTIRPAAAQQRINASQIADTYDSTWFGDAKRGVVSESKIELIGETVADLAALESALEADIKILARDSELNQDEIGAALAAVGETGSFKVERGGLYTRREENCDWQFVGAVDVVLAKEMIADHARQ